METHPTPLHHNQQPFLSKKLLDESKHSNSFACIRGSAMDSFIYTCYYLLPPFLKQTSVMTKCLLLMQPAGGSIAARKSHPPFPFICPSPTPLSLPSLSLMVYHFLCIFPASYSPNPPQSLTLLCVYLHKCVQCARLPGGHSCAAVAGGRGIPEPIHRGMTQTDLSKKNPQTHK